MRRNSKVKKINELLSDFLANKKTDKLEIINPFKLWIQVMGVHIKSETKSVYIKDHTLYISIKNPYLKSDLISQKSKILKKIKIFNYSIVNVIFN